MAITTRGAAGFDRDLVDEDSAYDTDRTRGVARHVTNVGNLEKTLLASAARTATVSTADQTLYNGRGVRLFINVTASAATPSVVFTLEVKDPVSGTYTAVLTSAAIVGAGHTTIICYPGITAAANVAVSMAMSRTWRVTATHADADSITYSLGACELL